MAPSPKRIIDEVWERQRHLAKPRRVDLARLLHPKQHKFAADPARFKVARCSRRAGKTIGAGAMLLESAQTKPGSVSLYITKTAKRAKELLWVPLKRLNAELGLGGVPNGQELSITLPNDSVVRLAGANTRDKIEDRRGDAIGLALLDEAQTLPAYISDLVDSVLAPATIDYNGTIALTGTPPPVPAGFFHEVCTNPEWALHEWTVWDNPFISKKSGRTVRELLDDELRRKGIDETAAVIQREWFGRVAIDSDALVLHYNVALNDFDALPARRKPWQYIICADVGYEDADAVGALAWTEDAPDLYLVEESVLPKQTISKLGERIAEMNARLHPLAIVMDMGGLGKKIAMELQARFGLPIEAAEKERKIEHLELLDDGLRTARVKARKDSRFAQDCALLEWDRDKSTPDKRVISDRYHSDACDMVLYGYRRALHWLHVPEKPAPPPLGTPEWHTHVASETLREIESGFERQMAENKADEKRRRMEEEWG